MDVKPALIYSKISAIMDEMEAVPKANTMEQGQRYKYRSIDQVKNASNPLFAKHKVFYSPKVIEKEVREVTSKSGTRMLHYTIKVLYSLYAEDGSKVECEVYGEAMDSGDKGLGKAQTYAEKVMLIQVLNIPLEDQPDPDHEKPELGNAKTDAKPPQTTKPTPAEAKPRPSKPAPPAVEDFVSKAQLDRLHKIAGDIGWKPDEVKEFLKKKGYKSRKDVLKKDYDALVKEIQMPTPKAPSEPDAPPQNIDDDIPF